MELKKDLHGFMKLEQRKKTTAFALIMVNKVNKMKTASFLQPIAQRTVSAEISSFEIEVNNKHI